MMGQLHPCGIAQRWHSTWNGRWALAGHDGSLRCCRADRHKHRRPDPRETRIGYVIDLTGPIAAGSGCSRRWTRRDARQAKDEESAYQQVWWRVWRCRRLAVCQRTGRRLAAEPTSRRNRRSSAKVSVPPAFSRGTGRTAAGSARQDRCAHQILVDGAGRLATFADCPDHQGLATAHVAGRIQLRRPRSGSPRRWPRMLSRAVAGKLCAELHRAMPFVDRPGKADGDEAPDRPG